MPYTRKNCDKEMNGTRRTPEKTLGNVISLRISDQEKRVLERFIKRTSKNASDIMREAMNQWISSRNRFCIDA